MSTDMNKNPAVESNRNQHTAMYLTHYKAVKNVADCDFVKLFLEKLAWHQKYKHKIRAKKNILKASQRIKWLNTDRNTVLAVMGLNTIKK